MKIRRQLATSGARLSPRASLTALAFVAVMLIGVPLQSAQAQTFQTLYSFKAEKDGGTPYAGLLLDPAGNLYGTTIYGGSGRCFRGGCGVVFRIAATGVETVLYSFDYQNSGFSPLAGLIRDSEGNLYGTTSLGGDLNCNAPAGCGTVFRLEKAGKQTVLHSFDWQDGDTPYAALVRDPEGNLYGTTWMGGSSVISQDDGAVFKLDTAGKETRLHSFTGQADGRWPVGPLLRDAQGYLYGTTVFGGDMSTCNGNGCGVIFKINAAGDETVLYNFTGETDGSEPGEGLVSDPEGNLYGTTAYGGDLTCSPPDGCGVVFKVDGNGSETVLYAFSDETGDGYDPIAGLARDSAGNLYGTTYRGGAYGMGTVFEVDTAGNETVLHSFTGGTDGSYPYAGVILDSAGNLYGTTTAGGTELGIGQGVVFKITP